MTAEVLHVLMEREGRTRALFLTGSRGVEGGPVRTYEKTATSYEAAVALASFLLWAKFF
ncbi:hypothetical protein AB0K02_21020 [Streptomyces sp. NPDC049597]|uniref:hypothetical protein n=1 Tax=Streptomyces sp. NPDC049597 TaxID=3155276 RepID=UPI003427E4BA